MCCVDRTCDGRSNVLKGFSTASELLLGDWCLVSRVDRGYYMIVVVMTDVDVDGDESVDDSE